MADVNIGTARGAVRIVYESIGAAKAEADLAKFHAQQIAAGNEMSSWATKAKVTSNELKNYAAIQKEVANAQRISIAYEQSLNAIRSSGVASLKEIAEAETLAATARRSVADITEVLRKSALAVPEDMAKAGTLAAQAHSAAFLRESLKESEKNGHLVSEKINQSLAIAGISGGSRTGQLMGNALMGGMMSGISASTVAVVGSVVAVAVVAAAAVAATMHTLKAGFGELTEIQDTTATLNAIGTSGEKIAGVMKLAKEASDGTRFSIAEMGGAAETAFISGVTGAKELSLYLQTVADAAAVSHKPLATMALLFNQMRDVGKLAARDIRQFAGVGDIMAWVAEQMKITKAEATKLANAPGGGIDFSVVEQAIEAHIGGAAQHMSGVTEEAARLSKSIKELGATLLQPFFPDAAGQADIFSQALSSIRSKIEQFTGYIESHRAGLIEIWADVGKVLVSVGFVATNVFGVVMGAVAFVKEGVSDVLGVVSKGIADVIRGVADVKEFTGDKKGADNLRKTADAMSHWGDTALDTAGSLFKVTGNIFGFNKTLADSWAAINKWKDGALTAKPTVGSLGDSSEDTGKQLIGVDDALEKLGVTLEDTRKGMGGTNDEWQKFLETLADKKAPTELIDTLTKMRYDFENGGRAAKDYAKALAQMGDTSVSASTKATALIKALQDMKAIPGEAEDALSDYDTEVDKLTKSLTPLADVLEATGNQLILQNGQLDQGSVNGRALTKDIEELRLKATALAATGDYDPSDVWQRTHDALIETLKAFNITGDAAENLITKYLMPQHDFEIQFLVKGKTSVQNDLRAVETQLDLAKRDGKNNFQIGVSVPDSKNMEQIINSLGLQWLKYDPINQTAQIGIPEGADVEAAKKKINDLMNADPTQLQSQIKVITTKQDIIDQINGGDPLKIPAVLDFNTAGSASVPLPTQGQEMFPGSGFTWDTQRGWVPKAAPPAPPPVAPSDQTPSAGDNSAPGGEKRRSRVGIGVGPGPGGGGQGYFDSQAASDYLDSINTQIPSDATSQGENFAESFAQGIRNKIPDVLQAALEMATAATDPLGHSPAKVGPLAGSGWTYFRGRTYSEAYAEGIASGQEAIGGAALKVAGAASDPLTGSFAKMMKDSSEWVQFGKHIFDLVSSLTDISFNVMNVAQQMSGGRLFPKTYQRDPSKIRPGAGLPPWQPIPLGGQSPSASTSSAVTGAVPPTGPRSPQQTIADKMITAAMARGYSLSDAQAMVAWSIGESSLNPAAGAGTAHQGLFQQDSSYTNPTDADSAIKQFLDRMGGPKPPGAGKDIFDQIQGVERSDKSADWYRKFLPGAQQLSQGWTPNQGSSIVGGMAGAYGIPYGLPSGTNIGEGQAGFPAWVMALGQAFGVSPTTYAGHQEGSGQNRGIDWWPTGAKQDMSGKSYTPEQVARLQNFASYLASLNDPNVLQTIFQNPQSGFRTGVAGGKPVGPDLPGTTDTGYYSRGKNDWVDHFGHVHTAFDASIPLPGAGYAGSANQPVPVTLGPHSIDAQANPGGALDPSTVSPGLQDIVSRDPVIGQAIQAMRGGSQLGDNEVQNQLQHLDAAITDSNMGNTPESKARSAQLGQIRDGLMSQYGMKEGPSGLDTAQTITQNVSGLVGDAFGIVDSSLKSIESAKDIGDTLVKGIANSSDVNKIVDSVQSFIELGSKIAQTASDALGFAGTITGMAAGGDPSGGTAGAAAALGAASSIAGIVSQGFAAANAVIDLVQEGLSIVGKYAGRALENWYGLPGANDIKMLLDTMNGQLSVYDASNPNMKSVFNTMGRELGTQYPGRAAPTNNLYIYAGPGQDPRDTMSDAMFAVKTSGAGAFGYAT